MAKRLVRSDVDKSFMGVAAGLGDYFGIDPGLVRAGFVIGTLMSGPVIPISYGVLTLVMSPPDTPAGQLVTDGVGKAQELFGKAKDQVNTRIEQKESGYATADEIDEIKRNMKVEETDDDFLV